MTNTWPRRFLSVPTSLLVVNTQAKQASPRGYSSSELSAFVANIPDVYRLIKSGWTRQDFKSAQASNDNRTKSIGITYAKVFEEYKYSSLSAYCHNGSIYVDKGNHRVLAASALGVPVMPVWVSAASDHELDQVERRCSYKIQRDIDQSILVAHRRHVETLPQISQTQNPEKQRKVIDVGRSRERNRGR